MRRNYLWVTIAIGTVAYLYLLLLVTLELPQLADYALKKLDDELAKGTGFDSNTVRNLAYAIGALLGGIALAATVPFQLIKTWMNERQANTSEQGHITDRFTKAIGQLGQEKTVKILVREADDQGLVREVTRERTEPNLEVRLGAIYALERIAQDSERDHIPIMETLAAYIRQNSRAEAPRDLNLARFLGLLEQDPDQDNWKLQQAEITARCQNIRDWVKSLGPAPKLRDDVRAVFRVIERRDEQRRAYEEGREPSFRIDLVRANLQRTDLSRVNLDKMDLMEARLEGANLIEASMKEANLSWAKLEGADLTAAQMEGAVLSFAKMNGATLSFAQMEGALLLDVEMAEAELLYVEMDGAILQRVRMDGADLRVAQMEGVDLSWAKLEGANLFRAKLNFTDLDGWSIARASLRSVDFTGAKNLSQEAVNSAFGDEATILPEGITRPYHWEGVQPLLPSDPGFDDLGKDRAYQTWLANYGKGTRPGEEA
ncbi:MAG: pentapeptide repeat-containing protein [Pseudomonadota bacterium]